MSIAKEHPLQTSLFADAPLPVTPSELSPALKWAGGKRWLLPHLQPIWKHHRHRRLVEPFVGGMGIALGVKPTKAFLADSNEHLVNFYQWLQRGLSIEGPMVNDEAVFYASRSRFNALIKGGGEWSQEAAGLFYYLNRTCFNGLCRFNSKNEFNVPFGRYKNINYMSDFMHYRGILGQWEIYCQDFAQTVVSGDDFLFIDPPYDTPFTQYGKDNFTWNDQIRLVEWLGKQLVPMVVTNQATPRVLSAYTEAGFTVTTLLAPRRIASSGDRTPAMEMLATKNI